MGAHIVNDKFQSDKYPSCPSGKVPLSIGDGTAQDLLWEYARRRRAVDAEFSEDLETCLRAAGFVPPQHAPIWHEPLEHAPIEPVPSQHTSTAHVKQAVTAAFTAGGEYGGAWSDEAPDAATEAAVYADRVIAQLHTDTERRPRKSDELAPPVGRDCPGPGCPCPKCHGTGWYIVNHVNPDDHGVEDYDEVYCNCPDGLKLLEIDLATTPPLPGGIPRSRCLPDSVLSAEERQALLMVRRLVVVTAKSCSQRRECIVQIALLDRLLHGGS